MRRDLTIGLILLAAAIALPFLDPPRFLLTQMILLFIWATVVSQWNLVFGVAGIFSLAQVGLFALGAYTSGTMAKYLDMSIWYTFPFAGLVVMFFSMLLGLACLRLRGIYVALLTLAAAQVLHVLILNDTSCFDQQGAVCRPFTGGSSGLSGYGDLGFRPLLRADWFLGDYYSTLALLTIAMVVSFVIVNSRIGLAFQALRDNPDLARSRGVSQFQYQLLVFALSAFFTGVAGGFYAAHFGSIGPGLLEFSLLVFLIAMMVVGGIGNPWGPLVGAALLMIGEEGLREATENFRNVGLGVMPLVLMIALPDGIMGALRKAGQRITRRRASRSQAMRQAAE